MVTTTASLAAPALPSKLYWDDRARRFASRGAGLGAVCSYGMPWFYNRPIDVLQHLALRRWLRVAPGTSVLELGCGVGRWSIRLARRGAHVTGIDLSQQMVLEARRRAGQVRVSGRCDFVVADICSPGVTGRFDRVFGVTVLQHLMTPGQLEAALRNIRDLLAPGGQAILLEAAPLRHTVRCNTAVFVARDERDYQTAFRQAGLRLRATNGVDPAPFKTWFLPRYRSCPRALALAGLAGVTAAGFPIDVVAGRRWTAASWHKVFVLEAPANEDCR
jgi:SAM-dependent methyltransferase